MCSLCTVLETLASIHFDISIKQMCFIKDIKDKCS